MTAESKTAADALAFHQLSVSRGGRVVLQPSSAALRSGSWTAVVGPNGAGKSTLLQALAGLVPAAGGEVTLAGRSLGLWPARERARHLAWMGQQEPVDPQVRVIDWVALGRLPHQGWLGLTSADDARAVEVAMQRCGCQDWSQRLLGQLSGGERQRVLLARMLATESDVLLMDEPLANLDPPFQADWVRLVRRLAAQRRTLVTVLHELNIALQADRLLIIAGGQLLWHGAVADPDTHKTLCSVFDDKISIHPLHGRWVVLTE